MTLSLALAMIFDKTYVLTELWFRSLDLNDLEREWQRARRAKVGLEEIIRSFIFIYFKDFQVVSIKEKFIFDAVFHSSFYFD